MIKPHTTPREALIKQHLVIPAKAGI